MMTSSPINTSNTNETPTSIAAPTNCGFWDGYWLNREFPFVDGCGKQRPPANFRRCCEEVIAWRKLS